MRTTGIIRRVLATVVFAFICVVAVNAAKKDSFIYNSEENNGVVTSQVVYKLDDDQHSLLRYLKYDFAYNDKKQVVKKRAMKWNGERNRWENYYFIQYVYDASGVKVEYSRWNSERNMYEPTK